MQEPHLREAAPVAAPVVRDLESPTVRVIKPVKRRLRVGDLWRGREVIRVIAARDFKVKYKQSLLGPLWLLFQPLALLVAFFIAFRNLANVQPGIPYSVFALVGLSVWSFFQASMTIGTSSIVGNITLIRFTPCPRFAFPIAGLIASLPAFAVTMVAAIVAGSVTGTLSLRVALLPLGLLWLFLLTAGVVALTSSLTVRYRDILSAMPFLLQVALFLAPIGYPLSQLGPVARHLVELNPLTGIVEAWRWMTVADYNVALRPVVISLVMTGVVLVLGWRTFARLETTIGDEI
ncbi:MAG TPA: ABC transporter permease [Thermoleophilaceae bacterium]|jgi:lipopolysaccharide transport system permease protein|nr:ABC transporter permease [Thermoleophilaceae bacterium]